MSEQNAMDAQLELERQFKLQKLYDDYIPDFSGMEFEYIDFDGLDLQKAVFYEATFTNCGFINTNLRRADFERAIFEDCAFRNSDFSKANFEWANLSGLYVPNSNFAEANLWGADLTDAKLMGSNFEGADLTGVDLTNANLKGANLKDANLRGANLQGANLTGANTAGTTILRLTAVELGVKSDIFATPVYNEKWEQDGWGYHLNKFYSQNPDEVLAFLKEQPYHKFYVNCFEMLLQLCQMAQEAREIEREFKQLVWIDPDDSDDIEKFNIYEPFTPEFVKDLADKRLNGRNGTIGSIRPDDTRVKYRVENGEVREFEK